MSLMGAANGREIGRRVMDRLPCGTSAAEGSPPQARRERSKTDAEGKGGDVAILRARAEQTCPVAALHSRPEAAGTATGPLFREANRGGKVGS